MCTDNVITIELTIAGISILCLLMMLKLIFKSRKNGFIVLLRGLAVASLIFSSSYFVQLAGGNNTCGEGPYLYLALLGDGMQAGWTFFITFNLFRIVMFLQSVNIMGEYPYYLVLDCSVAVAFVIALGASGGHHPTKDEAAFHAFYWFRLTVITANFCMFLCCAITVRNMQHSVTVGKLTQYQVDGIKFIVFRLRFYGLAQLISRLGAFWYDFSEATLHSTSARYFNAFLGPSSGWMYFLVFLTMQPDGLDLFKKTFLMWLPARYLDSIQWPTGMNDKDNCRRTSLDDDSRGSEYVADAEVVNVVNILTRPISTRLGSLRGSGDRSSDASAVEMGELPKVVIRPTDVHSDEKHVVQEKTAEKVVSTIPPSTEDVSGTGNSADLPI